jgi:hypothetical protein
MADSYEFLDMWCVQHYYAIFHLSSFQRFWNLINSLASCKISGMMTNAGNFESFWFMISITDFQCQWWKLNFICLRHTFAPWNLLLCSWSWMITSPLYLFHEEMLHRWDQLTDCRIRTENYVVVHWYGTIMLPRREIHITLHQNLSIAQ